jgi:hypothetical protein
VIVLFLLSGVSLLGLLLVDPDEDDEMLLRAHFSRPCNALRRPTVKIQTNYQKGETKSKKSANLSLSH